MELDTYQGRATVTCVNAGYNIQYLLTGLVAEAGEVAGKFAKAIRDKELDICNPDYSVKAWADLRQEVSKELGDVLWFVATLSDFMMLRLEEVAAQNLEKVEDRTKRGVIGGSGDER